jgi:hypothetical protein
MLIRLRNASETAFDTAAYTRNLESPYEAVYERYQSGLPPAHLNEELAG